MVSSKSGVREGLDRMAELDEQIAALTAPLADERGKIKEAVDEYVLDKFQAGDGYEDEDWLATKVIGHTRTWDVEALTRIVPRGVLKNITELKVIPAKIDQYVREGKLDRKKIAKAFTEKPNKPYVKVTKREKTADKGAQEAATLADKLS